MIDDTQRREGLALHLIRVRSRLTRAAVAEALVLGDETIRSWELGRRGCHASKRARFLTTCGSTEREYVGELARIMAAEESLEGSQR
jgi:hypothetical protein